VAAARNWFQVPKSEEGKQNADLARIINLQATSRETNQIQLRWRNLVFFRHLTGRPDCFNYYFGMAKRPSTLFSYYGSTDFQPPVDNQIAAAGDVYVNKLGRQRTFLSVLPERGNFEMRLQSKGLEQWMDAALDELTFWDQYPLVIHDAIENGTGWLKFEAGLKSKILITRPHSDCVLFGNPDEDKQNEVIERVWISRSALEGQYKDNPEALAAIAKAPQAWPAFWFGTGSLDCSDVIPLLDCWYVDPNGGPGRHVRALANYIFVDEVYDGPTLPYEKFAFNELSSGVFGQGLVETAMSLQDEYDDVLAAISENNHRCAWPKWMVEANSGVNERALGDTSGAVVKYQRDKPTLETHEANSPQLYAWSTTLREDIRKRCHISEVSNQGDIPRGLQSGAALDKYQQIDDVQYAEKGTRLESFVIKCGYQLIRLAADLKPDFTLKGRNTQLVKWDPAWVKEKRPVGLAAFGASRLPQTPAGRQQTLDGLLANGAISRTTWLRYSQIPDIDGLMDIQNAPQESVDRQLDDLLKGDYIPPTPFADLDYALKQVEARYCYEENWGTPEHILDLYLLYRSALKDLIADRDTPPQTPGLQAPPAGVTPAQGFGDLTSGNPAVAPSPPNIGATLPAINPGIRPS